MLANICRCGAQPPTLETTRQETAWGMMGVKQLPAFLSSLSPALNELGQVFGFQDLVCSNGSNGKLFELFSSSRELMVHAQDWP